MSRTSINILATGHGLMVFVNIYDPSTKSLASLFDEQYEKQILNILQNKVHYSNIITENVEFRLENCCHSSGVWTWVSCKLKHVSELLQVFADETLKAEITREVFEYV